MKPILYYVCGYQSRSDKSPKYAHCQRTFGAWLDVRPLDYPGSYDADRCWAAFSAKANAHMPALFMGSSLGGFWALHLANHYATPCILLNPCCHPSRLTQQHAQASNAATYQHGFAAWEQMPLRSDLARLAFLAKDDAVLDYREALRSLPDNTEFALYPTGGHTLWSRLPEVTRHSLGFLDAHGLI